MHAPATLDLLLELLRAKPVPVAMSPKDAAFYLRDDRGRRARSEEAKHPHARYHRVDPQSPLGAAKSAAHDQAPSPQIRNRNRMKRGVAWAGAHRFLFAGWLNRRSFRWPRK